MELGLLDSKLFDVEHLLMKSLCVHLKDAGLAFIRINGQFSDVDDWHFSFGPHSWFGPSKKRWFLKLSCLVRITCELDFIL